MTEALSRIGVSRGLLALWAMPCANAMQQANMSTRQEWLSLGCKVPLWLMISASLLSLSASLVFGKPHLAVSRWHLPQYIAVARGLRHACIVGGDLSDGAAYYHLKCSISLFLSNCRNKDIKDLHIIRNSLNFAKTKNISPLISCAVMFVSCAQNVSITPIAARKQKIIRLYET